MATSLRLLIFATLIGSCIGIALLIAAAVTPNWIHSKATVYNRPKLDDISYGLFSGEYVNEGYETPRKYPLTIICIFEENKCMYSLKTTADSREVEAKAVIAGANPNCDANSLSLSSFKSLSKLSSLSNVINNNDRDVLMTRADISDGDPSFNDAGIWVSTVLFLAIAILMAIVSGFFAVLNTATSPIEQILGVFGLYIWNGIGIGSCLLVLFIYGIYFVTSISSNIAICNTLTNRATSDGLASLGYSYWLVFMGMLTYIANICLLLLRYWLLARQPPPPKITIDDHQDGTIFLY